MKSNAYSEGTKRHETKEYEWSAMNLKYLGANRDPEAFAEIDQRFKQALKEIEASHGRRTR